MRYMSDLERRVLERLEELAWGNSDLVDEALQRAGGDGQTPDVIEVAKYIVENRESWVPAHVAAAAATGA